MDTDRFRAYITPGDPARWKLEVTLFASIIALWFVFDVFSTFIAIEHLNLVESNPSGRFVLANFGWTGVLVHKVLTLGVITATWLGFRRITTHYHAQPGRTHRVLKYIPLALLTSLSGIGLFIFINNSLALIHALWLLPLLLTSRDYTYMNI